MESIMNRKVNLRGMIQLDQMEDFLSHILERITQQDRIIEHLSKSTSQAMTIAYASEKFDAIEDNLLRLSHRLDMIEKAATTIVNGVSMTAGDLALQNHNSIENLTEISKNFINRLEVHKIADTIIELNHQDIKKLYDWSTPLDLSSKIQQLQFDISNRLNGVEMILPMKVDRSDVASLDVLATRLRAYDTFHDHTEQKLQHLSISTERLNNMTTKHAIDITRIKDEFEKFHVSLATKAPIHELSITNKQLNVNSMMIQNLGEEITALLREKIESCKTSIYELQGIANKHDDILSSIKADLTEKANTVDLKPYVLRKHYEEAVTALGSEIDMKTSLIDHHQATQRLTELEQHLAEEEKKISVAMRFVDWFVSRGVSYEHNMQVLDKHIENLAKASHPMNRQPYTGQIRYTPVMGSFKESLDKLQASGRKESEGGGTTI